MNLSRREYLALTRSAAGLAIPTFAMAAGTEEDRARRMKWWHEAKFGMFVHWGLYSVVGRHEWVMEIEGIPTAEYVELARRFTPKPGAARAWAKLARAAGMKYMVMTTKHHEGFCLFNTKLTSYCSPKQACGRDLVAEYVEAARAEGLRVGFYYSLMDWHHPDGARCASDPAARERFVTYTHSQIRELLTNYGKIDILWYDVSWPLDASGWRSEEMNRMVFELQPDIIVNNRNRLRGDFQTPEQEIRPPKDQAWEACMTMNESWGYHWADDDWKSPRQVVRNLATCARRGGNYLLNIGPKPDGSVPAESVRILTAVGKWMDRNAESVRTTESCQVSFPFANQFTRRGNTLYIHCYYWLGRELAVGGLKGKVLSARLLATGAKVNFEQASLRTRFYGLPDAAPDSPATVIAVEFDSEPKQERTYMSRERLGV